MEDDELPDPGVVPVAASSPGAMSSPGLESRIFRTSTKSLSESMRARFFRRVARFGALRKDFATALFADFAAVCSAFNLKMDSWRDSFMSFPSAGGDGGLDQLGSLGSGGGFAGRASSEVGSGHVEVNAKAVAESAPD